MSCLHPTLRGTWHARCRHAPLQAFTALQQLRVGLQQQQEQDQAPVQQQQRREATLVEGAAPVLMQAVALVTQQHEGANLASLSVPQ